MQWLRCFTAHITLSLLVLAVVTSGEGEGDIEDDSTFADLEDPPADRSGDQWAPTEEKRLRREELPEDGFVWPTTDEENFADQLSKEHHCKGCRAVAFQVDKALKEMMPKDGSKRALPEHEYLEAMECKRSIYEDYGLKKLQDNSRVLSGPGIPDGEEGGSMFGGARWPSRLASFCGNLIGDIGEEEVYRLWVDHGSDGFADVLCSATCDGVKRIVKEPEEEEEESVKKKRRRKSNAKKKEEANVDGPPQVVKIYEKKELKKLNKKFKFVFLLFCAPSFPRCFDLEMQWELAARAVQKSADLKGQAKFAVADTDQVGTFGYDLQGGVLPAFLLFRKGYLAPKGISPEEMLRLREAGDFLNYLQTELGHYMQDDPDSFPRGKMEL